ncbi:3-oxoacyl-ACP synthase [Tenacibaculum sp. E3R01]|uniref:3-oxoacyl-ACP synthase n=1 Tax=Tenacibaculum sp. E3R01 TaxID=2267227 RepID=UPI000DE8F48B|nr:3-oxoacyl-ACP synthase [Tenacibaculum sp. E3R01]RBW59462.1 3-oxoacyl-ACP synthase [Tenacibaculum sp. E3R01]
MNVKELLYNECEAFVNNRLQTIESIISSNKKALHSETKSSAGDKHETGRAMLQLEMEKAGQQLNGVQQMKETLARIVLTANSSTSCLGSIIETNSFTYFLSISAGKIIISNKTFFAVSVSSPIGKLLLGKTVNDELTFNGKKIAIKNIL